MAFTFNFGGNEPPSNAESANGMGTVGDSDVNNWTKVEPFSPTNPMAYSPQGSTMWTTEPTSKGEAGGDAGGGLPGRGNSSIVSCPGCQDSSMLIIGGSPATAKQRSQDVSSLRDVHLQGVKSPYAENPNQNPLDSLSTEGSGSGPVSRPPPAGGAPRPKQDLVLKSLDIPTAVDTYRANKKQSEEMNEVVMKIKAPDGGIMMRHRVPPHITSLEGGGDPNDQLSGAALQAMKTDGTSSSRTTRAQGRDIVQGSYLGGLKIWSCAPHLCEFLVYCVYTKTPGDQIHTSSGGGSGSTSDSAAAQEALRHGFLRQTVSDCLRGPVLELGCGHGLPGITALRLGAEDVTFLDFNQEVIDEVTIPNIALNAKVDEDEREKDSTFSLLVNKKKSKSKFTSTNTKRGRDGKSSSVSGVPVPVTKRQHVELQKYDINPEAIVRTCSGDWTNFEPPRFFVRTWSEIEGTSARSLPPSAQFNTMISSPRPSSDNSGGAGAGKGNPIQILKGNNGDVRQFSELSLDQFEGSDSGSPGAGSDGTQKFSLILGSDVTYDDSTTFSVLMAISHLLEPRNGVAFISTKPFYFGTGGGWAFVQETIRKWSKSLNGMTATVVEHTKSGQGMERMVIMIQVGT